MLFDKVLSDAQIEQIREATEDVLETIGVKVEHDETLGLLRRAGASVDEPSGIVSCRGAGCSRWPSRRFPLWPSWGPTWN